MKILLFWLNFDTEDNVTVIISIKNREVPRLENALKSIRSQTYNQRLILILLIDYDSNQELAAGYRVICEKYKAEYIRVENRPIWNKSHALNIGIRKTKTKYILLCDSDNILKENFLEIAIKELRKNPLQLIVANMMSLPFVPLESMTVRDFESLAKRTCNDWLTVALNVTLAYFYKKIRGFDERYKLYGCEDLDLAKRFYFLGLDIKSIADKTSYFHQYHPYHAGVNSPALEEQMKSNSEYYKNSNSIVRNKSGWGEINGPSS